MEKVGIVILNYNGQKFLEKFLPGITKHSRDHQIYVADNASSDGSLSFLSEYFPTVGQIPLDQNYGFCGGYNRALEKVKEELCILINSDVEVSENWIQPLINLITSQDSIVAVQPKILAFHNPEYFEYAGGAGGYIDKYGYPFCRGRIFENIEKDEGQYDNPVEIFWATGACMMVKKSAFIKFGGFDELFFAHMEEIDLCWRFKNAGLKVMYCPDSKVYHVGGGTLAKNNPKKIYFNFRNSLYMLVKNLPGNQVFFKTFLRLLLDFPAAITFLISGSPKSFYMVIKAHFDFYRHLSMVLNTRNEPVPNPKSLAGYYPKSILVSYFIKGIKKYSGL